MTEVKILVADDDEQLLEMMIRRLKRKGLDADRAEDGNVAMRMIEHTSYDLIVTDLYMPGATGLALMRAAKERDQHTQVVVVTGSATMENAIEALNNGAFGYLNKPFDHVNVFDNMVARALEFRRLILDNQRMAEIQRKRGDLLEEEVTERVKQLRERQKAMLELLSSLPDGILLVEEGGRVVLSSPVAENWLARELETGGQPIQRFVETLFDEWADERLEVEIDSEYVRLQAIDLTPNDGKKRKVVIIHVPDGNLNGHLSDRMRDPLENLKNGLSWLYQQQMGTDINQILMALANHVSDIEKLVEESTKSNGHQTAELAEIEGIPSLESLMQRENAEEEFDLGGTLELDDGELTDSSESLIQEDDEDHDVERGRYELEEGSELAGKEVLETQDGLRRRLFQKKERWTDLLVKAENQEESEDTLGGDQVAQDLKEDEKFEAFLEVLDEAAKDCPPDHDVSPVVDEEDEKRKMSSSEKPAHLKTGEWPPLPPSKTERLDPGLFNR